MNEGIELRSVGHIYRPRGRPPIAALDDVSFEVSPGEVVGLLGPNGAGKTTCVRVLSTLLIPTGGSAAVGGADVVDEAKRVRQLCGVSFGGDLGLYTRLSARDNLRYFATMYRLPKEKTASRVSELLDQVGLAERADDRVETFSRGMRQRLHLARALLHDPPVLLLDEPSAGLDPEGARGIREHVKRTAGQGRAVLLTTHDMAEAEELCSRVVVLHRGKVLRHASPAEIRDEAARRLGSSIEIQDDREISESVLRSVPGFLRSAAQDGRQVIFTDRAREAVSYLLEHLGSDASFQISKPSLVEAYLDIVAPEEGNPSTHS